MNTPWGRSQSVKDLGSGVLSVTTASHGGIYVPVDQLKRIPREAQDYAKRWSGSKHWYEEDCAWAHVAVSMPELFREDEVECARSTVEWIANVSR